MSFDDMIDAQRRMAAIERETDFQRMMGVTRNIDTANRLYNLQSTVARIQDQINPAIGIANALRESAALATINAQTLQQEIADAARDALRLREAERGIVEIIRRATDPLAGIRNSLLLALEESNRFVATVSAATAANLRTLQQPLVELNEYFRIISHQIAEPYIAQVAAVQKAAEGIATIFEFARPDISTEAEELSVSDDELAALFTTAFPDGAGPIDGETFARGVETILTAIDKAKDSRLQKAIAQYAFPLLLFLLTIFLAGEKPRELPPSGQSKQAVTSPHPAPKACVGRRKYQGIAVVTATALNLREKHSGSSRIVGRLKSGERVKIIQSQGTWTEVETNRARGWVVTKYLRPEKA